MAQVLALIDAKRVAEQTVFLEMEVCAFSCSVSAFIVCVCVDRVWAASKCCWPLRRSIAPNCLWATRRGASNSRQRLLVETLHEPAADHAATQLVPPFDRIVTDDPNECRFHVVSFMTLTAVAHGIQVLSSPCARPFAHVRRHRCRASTLPLCPQRARACSSRRPCSTSFAEATMTAPQACVPWRSAARVLLLVAQYGCCKASGVYHVLYSMHSSFSELVRFASLVQPKRVVRLLPCASKSSRALQIPITDCDPDAFRQLCAPDKRARRSAHSPADDDDVLDWLV